MRILIVEDELTIKRRIERLTLEILGNQVISLHAVDNLSSAFKFLGKNEIDLLLLDLNLKGKDGFEVLDNMLSKEFHTIIISAYEERAITAFEHGVLDFVPKPFGKERLEKAFDRLMDKNYRLNPATKQLAITSRGMLRLIKVEDVKYIKGAGIYSELYLKNGSKELHAKSLDKLINLLPISFVRVHKSYIVDQETVNHLIINQGGKYELLLKSKDVVPMGRTYYKQLKVNWIN